MKKLSVITLVAAAIMGVGQLSGEVLSITVENHKVIENPADSNEQQVLIRFEIPEIVAGADIHSAYLIIRPSFAGETTKMTDFHLYPLKEEINVEASDWDDIWTEPDATLDVASGSHATANPDSDANVTVDLTHWVENLVRSETANNGLLLKCETPVNESLSLLQPVDAPNGSVGVLRVEYSKSQ